ncbi:MAG: putative CRISPR-associated protein [Anaerolineae bacterium]|nr:putative CRISPR-associated protein [Anaerolineae bacterium]
MPVCVISTVGTSIFSQANKDIQERWREFEKLTEVDLDPICNLKIKDFKGRDLYHMTLEVLRAQSNDIAAVRRASAELNSLSRIIEDEDTNHRLTFLATDTSDGALAARIVADFSAEFFKIPADQVKLYRIKGLQVRDGRSFRRDGVRNLIAKIFDALDEAKSPTYDRVLNPTGGFKSAVPYLTVIGMTEENVRVSYIFERSEELISLKKLPIQLDLDQLLPFYQVIQKAEQEFVPEAEMLKALRLNSREDLINRPIWPLLDQDTDNDKVVYSINGLGVIALRYLREKEKLKRSNVYLSKAAYDTYSKLDSTQQTHVGKLLKQMGNKNWRDNQKSEVHGAIIAKPHDDFRFFFFEKEDGSVLIAEIVRHSDRSYERLREGPKLKLEDYPRLMMWE